ncbi:MAG: DUF484 family protein [Thiohalocapsa sp.]|nr:DUF484 family protein [Thiohalocapsa sp.]MCF7990847.1 DUF484 family protein [Thiohalocapsa sp.]
MTTRQVDQADDEYEKAMAAYLMRHTDFLVRHPQVLAKLHVPHGAGGAVSLIEHQVSVLREQLATERGRLNHLVHRARDYEELSARLHELTLKLILAHDLEHAHKALQDALREQFNADAVALKLFPLEAERAAADPLIGSFVDFVARDRCVCGPLKPEQTRALFDDTPGIQSAALVPINAHGQTGVLAIGSTDPARFTPDMGTDLLERLGAIASAKLTDLGQRR